VSQQSAMQKSKLAVTMTKTNVSADREFLSLRSRLPSVGAWAWRYCCVGRPCERSQQQHQPPPLIFAETLLEGRHGLVTFAEFIKQFAVGHRAHVRSVSEVRRCRIVQGCVMAVAFAGIPMARPALVEIERSHGFHRAIMPSQRVSNLLGLLWHGPRSIFLDCPHDRGKHHHEQQREQSFACFKTLRRARRHWRSRNFRTSAMEVEERRAGKLYPNRPPTKGAYPRRISQRYSKLRKRMTTATIHPMIEVIREFTSSPILARSPVN
jgi:hypothetical protein